MLSLTKLKQAEHDSKQKKKIEFELPYFITFVTLLATSGFGPYTIFKKMHEISLLPNSRIESDKILKRVDLLGLDPLTAMTRVKERSSSKQFGEFLGGYVSSIRGGGDVISYLKSTMNSTLDRFSKIQSQLIDKVKAIVEAYMTMLVVILAVYIIINSLAIPAANDSIKNDFQILLIIFPPLVTLMFILIAHNMNKSKLKELEIKKIIVFGFPCVSVAFVIIMLGVIPEYQAMILGGALVVASLWPTISFKKKYQITIDAEAATPPILRDITETRKAGIGPERCIVNACKRKDFGAFNPLANSIASRLEWGSSLKDIYDSLKNEIQNFQVLISFKILFEIISSGGGNVHTLESLAGTAEKTYNIEKSKREMLKPYLMIGFMLIGLTSFTTLMVIDSFSSISLQSEVDPEKFEQIKQKRDSDFRFFSFAVIIQAWLAGLFLGKITTGSYSGGFQYSAMLVVIALAGVLVIQSQVISVGSMFDFI